MLPPPSNHPNLLPDPQSASQLERDAQNRVAGAIGFDHPPLPETWHNTLSLPDPYTAEDREHYREAERAYMAPRPPPRVRQTDSRMRFGFANGDVVDLWDGDWSQHAVVPLLQTQRTGLERLVAASIEDEVGHRAWGASYDDDDLQGIEDMPELVDDNASDTRSITSPESDYYEEVGSMMLDRHGFSGSRFQMGDIGLMPDHRLRRRRFRIGDYPDVGLQEQHHLSEPMSIPADELDVGNEDEHASSHPDWNFGEEFEEGDQEEEYSESSRQDINVWDDGLRTELVQSSEAGNMGAGSGAAAQRVDHQNETPDNRVASPIPAAEDGIIENITAENVGSNSATAAPDIDNYPEMASAANIDAADGPHVTAPDSVENDE